MIIYCTVLSQPLKVGLHFTQILLQQAHSTTRPSVGYKNTPQPLVLHFVTIPMRCGTLLHTLPDLIQRNLTRKARDTLPFSCTPALITCYMVLDSTRLLDRTESQMLAIKVRHKIFSYLAIGTSLHTSFARNLLIWWHLLHWTCTYSSWYSDSSTILHCLG